jgi:hypothetical protein
MINGRKTYDDYFKDRDKKNNTTQSKPSPTSTMFGRNTSGVLAINTDYGNSVYDENLNWGADINPDNIQGSINEHRAEQQSGLDHLGIGLARAGAKAAVEVAKLPGVIGGIAISPFADKNEGFETAFNNQWVKYFDGLDEKVKEALPVYTKESVKNGDFFDKVSSSAFWAEDGADGAGFMLGMLAPGAIFKLAGGANSLFGASIKAAKLAKYGEGMEAGRKALMEAGITIDKIDQYMIPAFNTIAEAGSEAKGVSDDLDSRKGEFIQNYPAQQSKALQELDIRRRNGEINIDEYNKLSNDISNKTVEEAFKEQKALAMQNTFIKNIAILAVPNYIQSKMLFGKTPSKVLLDKIGSIEKTGFKESLKKAGERIGETFLSEGSEEIAQTVTENRNVDSAIKGKLGNSRLNDYNPLTFGSDFIKTLGTTEGQIAGFLGGMMGSPISVITGHGQDIADRKQTERLRDKINGESTAYQDVVKTNLYKQEEYTNPETGEVSTRDKLVNGKKVFIPEAVVKVKNALDLTEQHSQIYDKAIQESDTNTIEYLKGQAEFNLIQKFIGEDQVTLDGLHEYLKVAFPTETSKDISEEQVKINKENIERVDKIMKKATSLQKDLSSYKDTAASIIRIDNPEVTEEHLVDFMNRVGSTFISDRAEEFDAKDKLQKLQKQRADLETNSSIIEIINPNYIEGKTEDIFKTIKTKTNNPRLNLVNSQIIKVEEQLKDFEEATNSTIWDNEWLNNKINNEVVAKKKLQEATSPEIVAKAEEISQVINNATTTDELDNLPKTNTNVDKVLQQKANEKKVEIIAKEEVINNEERVNATQEDSDFNNVTTYDGLTATEGSIVTDELIPQENENNTSEELKSIQNSEVDYGLGVKVISTDRNTGLPLNFISEQFPLYLEYEREPVNKSGKEVGFEINQNPGKNPKVIVALNAFNNKDFSNPKLLIDFLPINVQFTNEVKAPIETRRITNDINIATELLRIEIVNNLIKGISINDIKTTIQDQYKGLLKVDSNRFANNNILQLNGIKDLNYIRENIYVINSFGKLQNILNDKIFEFNNDKIKPNAAGEIYLTIPQTNGKLFPLKLNIKKISESEAVLLYEIYKEIITNEKSLDTTISEVNNDLKETITTNFEAELNIIGGNKNDIKLQEIIDLLIYQSANIKSQMQIVNGILYYGDKESTIDTIEQDQNEIIDFLINQKRHQIKINPKSEIDNTKTNLKSNSADYLKYLVDNNILSTNAVVNEPTFQGYTNIYLNTSITVTNQPKVSESGVEVKIDNTGFDSLFGNNQEIIKDVQEKFKASKIEVEYLKNNLTTNNVLILARYILRSDINDGKLSEQDLIKNFYSISKKASENILNRLNELFKKERNFNRLDIEINNLLNNIRNSQENFLSLSEIPGTVENFEIKETQDRVFNEKRNPKQRQTDFRRMDVLFKKKQEGNLTSEKELRDFEMFKQMYPQEYEKRCK